MLKMYAIYNGLSGGFGGATLTTLEKFENHDQAIKYARDEVIQDYQSYEGMHGILSEDECEEQEISYQDEIDSWVDFDAIEITKENYKDIAEDFGSDDQTMRIYKYVEEYLGLKGE